MAKYVDAISCCYDLTIATRWIGFLGMLLSLALTTVLLNDKFIDDYTYSRGIAFALGLDWQHFHETANATQTADQDGALISIIMVFYSTAYLVTNMTLIFATITDHRWCTVPWLVFELFNCVSKVVAMLVHQVSKHEQFTTAYYVGSTIYVVVGIWWWCVVYRTQRRWRMSGGRTITRVRKDGEEEEEDVVEVAPAGGSYRMQERVDNLRSSLDQQHRRSYNPTWTRTMSTMPSASSISFEPNPVFGHF